MGVILDIKNKMIIDIRNKMQLKELLNKYREECEKIPIDPWEIYTAAKEQISETNAINREKNPKKPKKKAFKGKGGRVNVKRVDQLSLDGEYIATYRSMREAERMTGIASSHISSCCKGDSKHLTVGGYKWRYADDTNKCK